MADEDVKELRSTIASLLKDRIKSRIQTALLSEGANSVVNGAVLEYLCAAQCTSGWPVGSAQKTQAIC